MMPALKLLSHLEEDSSMLHIMSENSKQYCTEFQQKPSILNMKKRQTKLTRF